MSLPHPMRAVKKGNFSRCPQVCVPPLMRLTTGSTFIGDTTMRKVTLAATLLSLALVGSASAQQVVATDPVTGAATGAAAGAAQGAAVAGPIGALVGAPLGLAAGAVA